MGQEYRGWLKMVGPRKGAQDGNHMDGVEQLLRKGRGELKYGGKEVDISSC